MQVRDYIDKALQGYNLSINEIVDILKLHKQHEDVQYLFNKAEETTIKYCGKEVQIRGIIEFSNHCRCKCAYCGLNCENNVIERYRMSIDEIVENAKEAYEAGYKTLVLQSGEDIWYTEDKINEIIKRIKAASDIVITLSIGERSFKEYMSFKKAGADRFLIKHETADNTIYNELHPHSNFDNRLTCLKNLKKLGYQVGSGFMVGLPNQTYETLAKDILLLKNLDVDMAGVGPFIPHPLTRLKNYKKGDTFLTLKVVALLRIILKDTHLPATTSLGVVSKEAKDNVFSSGANVIMQKVEPYKYRSLYNIYPTKSKIEKTIMQERKELEDYILSVGKKVSKTRGDSFKIKK